MNRFRTKKKAKDDTSTGRSSQDEPSSMPSFKSFRRGKKQQPEETKKEIDLATALPSTDDFRTSLLMSNLSARFSMLREQDDPNTKIGKASDDSVLYPKRQSRMADFGFSTAAGGLSDIAEVESIKASRFMRTSSFVSDDADSTQGVSIMNRSKPTEGNNLFGGRQKIYKIPAGKNAASGDGAMVGRALYDDDVALSSFQRWRKAERERSFEEQEEEADSPQAEEEVEPTRSESPPLSYNRRRETSSTTSSASIMARNSTAATSITSQPTAAMKDWQATAPNSATSTPVVERSVTRTRRLYEQGLTQDMQDQQTSALSRMDTFSRQKPLGSRTPDIGANSPSPTTNGFTDRFLAGEKRTLLTKSSAPNLKPISPPATGPLVGTMDLGIKLPSQVDSKLNFGGSPPLSPPISETGDQPLPLLPIQPNDVGKATAMGVFQKPLQPYDESKYAQRQIQLQQGRDTPTGRFRAESNASFVTGRSRSSSSVQRQNLEIKTEPIRTQPAVQEEARPSFFPKPEPLPLPTSALSTSILPAVAQRPADEDHPAFRQSALPTPLSISTKMSGEPSPISEHPDTSEENSAPVSPEDSPTLGPNNGLSGLVRQHLRSDSNASSVYGPAPPTSDFASRFPLDPYEQQPGDMGSKSNNPWLASGQEWTLSYYGDGAEPASAPASAKFKPVTETKPDVTAESKGSDRSSNITEDDTDEFANQLANARRRVREKLTSYVESDSSRGTSPMRHSDSSKDLSAQPSPNALGIGMLKPKSSRGSLADRSRTIATGQNKAMKMLGIGATMSTSPGPSRQLSDDLGAPREIPHEKMAEEIPRQSEFQESRRVSEVDNEPKQSLDLDGESNAHPGLRAFRQAKRELQRRKELELLAKHQITQTTQPRDGSFDQPPMMQSPPKEERRPRQRTPSRERKPPPISYRQRAPSEENSHGTNNSPATSKTSGERERSGSEVSGSRSSSRTRPPPPRLRNNTGPYDDQMAPSNVPRPQMLRAPGLPGTDIRRSPIMPPQGGYSNRSALSPAASPYLHGSKSTGNLAGRPGYETHSGLPSPISPLPGSMPPSPYTNGPGGSPMGTPTSFGPRPRQASSAVQSPAFGPASSGPVPPTKRFVDKRDISEPTFVMSTSRVPTVNLPQVQSTPELSNSNRFYGGQRYQSENKAGPGSAAPPLPPINPRRKRENSRAQEYDDGGLSAPHLPYASQGNGSTSSLDYVEENRSAFSTSDDEEGSKVEQRRRLRKPTIELPSSFGGWGPGMKRDKSPPFVVKGPPASRTVVTSSIKPNPNMGGPGGMF
ncbi:hypothetical protein B0T25DRAFT_246804 [Lasiosphaeria hispida]|uniref:Uncharacterized protein n=1 Tax=Lasiosphaeria hispida TaxID=260671 RepID=A0AAJ0MCV6_9PEZI|nr:hypothetical protein B0T25DRAFT_246804 [Lasiosphaeria hispida]